MLRVISYYLLNSISTLGDSIFLYFVSMTLLQKEQGGILCSLILGIDASLEILIGPILAKFIDAIPEITFRLRKSILINLFLVILALIPSVVMMNQGKLPLLILIIILMRFFILMDNQLKAALPLFLDEKKKILLVRSLSLSIFSGKSIFLVSASLAPVLIHKSWMFSCSLNSLTYLCAASALVLMIKMTKDLPLKETNEIEAPHFNELKRKWLGWTCLYYFLSNIAFGGIILILTTAMVQAKNESFLFQALKGPSLLYAGILISLTFLMIFPRQGNTFSKNALRLCFINMTIGLGFILMASFGSLFQMIGLFIIGIVNGFSFVASETFLQRKMEGKGFVKAIAKAIACGRAGFIISLLVVGFCIDQKFSPNALLAMAGGAAILFSLFLFLLALPLKKSMLSKEVYS